MHPLSGSLKRRLPIDHLMPGCPEGICDMTETPGDGRVRANSLISPNDTLN